MKSYGIVKEAECVPSTLLVSHGGPSINTYWMNKWVNEYTIRHIHTTSTKDVNREGVNSGQQQRKFLSVLMWCLLDELIPLSL